MMRKVVFEFGCERIRKVEIRVKDFLNDKRFGGFWVGEFGSFCKGL